MSLRPVCVLVLGCATGLFAGCGSGLATVSGEVSVDGKAVEKGVISYVPADGPGEPATANIENGRYELRTSPGNKRVQISVPVVVDRRKDSPAANAQTIEITRETLPERFNSKTELTFEVKSGSNTKDWPLDTKKK
jgi:hypothetical protein